MSLLTRARPPKSEADDIPTKREANPEFARLIDQKDALSVACGPLLKERNGIYERIREHGEQRASPITDMQVRAAALVGDPAPVGEQDDKRRLQELANEIAVFDKAMGTLAARIDVESAVASRAIVEHVTPRYREAVASLCERIVDLHRANKAFHQLTDELNDRDVVWSGTLLPMHADFFGSPTDKHSRPAIYLREAVMGGFFPAGKIPTELTL